MRRPIAVAPLLIALVLSLAAFAQDASTHAPAGVNQERIPSIFVPPVANAPFTATVSMDVTRTLPDGSTVTQYNQRVVMRDSTGRVFQERRTLVPKNGQRQPMPWRTEFSDPASHQKYFCELQRRVCRVGPYAAPTSFNLQPAGPLPAQRGNLTRESLGKNFINGVEADGTRETTVLNAGTVGNDRPLTITREFWYSLRLGINVVEKRVDPRDATVSIQVSNISLTEPDASYFAVPSGFSVIKTASANAE